MLSPTTEAELADAVASAKGPLRIRGGGTRTIGKPVAGEVLSTAGLTGITLYEPGSLTIVARAGTSLAEIETALASEGQRLAFEPMDHRGLLGTTGEPTIGGIVAANVSGPRRIQAGAARDFMLGVRFVDGRGTVVSNGGRVMKNVTGYDLVKLLTGSYGTLGVLSEVSMKVLPDVSASATLVLLGLDDAQAIAALSAGLRSPFEVTGAAHDPAAGRTLLRIEGFASSVAYRAGRLVELLAAFGRAQIVDDPQEVKGLWRQIGDANTFHDRAGDVWRLSVKPSDAAGIVAKLVQTQGDLPRLYDWGGGLIWLLTPGGTDLRAHLGDFDGHATLIRASEATRAAVPVFQPEPAPLAAIVKGLRAKFDPRGILNPGLMG